MDVKRKINQEGKKRREDLGQKSRIHEEIGVARVKKNMTWIKRVRKLKRK
jgi:hypothetical protein